MNKSDFPDDFVWGSATASYQIEGAVTEGGRGPSVWDTFTHTPGTISDGTNGDVAVDHFHRFADDVQLMTDIGFDAYRFSIAWSRIQPEGTGAGNTAGLGFYRELIEKQLEQGITPWVTLYHWDLPQALEDAGGWLNRDTALRFADYSQIVAENLGDLVTDWITLNEPWCSSFLGYANGHHAPGKQLGSRSAHAAHHLLLGHGLAVDRIREAVPEGRVGITLNLYSIRAASESAADQDAARRIDGLSNRLFLDPMLTGEYPADVLDDLGETSWFEEHAGPDDLSLISTPIDFMGINYYSRHTVRAGAPSDQVSAYPGSEFVEFVDTGADRTQMGWEIHPDGLVDVVRASHRLAPELPIYITENGSAYEDVVGADGTVNDPERLKYLQQHIAACQEAIAEGLPLKGYFAWSLMDNFEWAWGFSRRFGLVHVNYDNLERTLKASGRWLTEFLSR